MEIKVATWRQTASGAGRSLDSDPLCRARASRRTRFRPTEDSRPRSRRHARAQFPGIGSSPARCLRRAILRREKIDRKYAAARAGWIPSPVSATRSIARFASLFRPTSIDPPAGVNFSALSSRLTIRRRRCPSLPLTKTSSGASTESFISRDCASGPTVAAISLSSARRFSRCRSTITSPLSRDSISSSSAIRHSDSASRCAAPSAARFSSGVRSRASATSSPVRSTDSGVRSSCAASDANLRSVADARSRRSSSELISAVSRATSSATGGTVSRELRLVGPIASSSACNDSIGRSARPASRYPPPTQSISSDWHHQQQQVAKAAYRFLDQTRLHAALQVRDLAVVQHRNDRESESAIADDRRMRRAAPDRMAAGWCGCRRSFRTRCAP